MSVLAIELDDAGIRAARAPGADLLVVDEDGVASPGVAWIEGGTTTTGLAAMRRTCLRPRAVHDRFWDRLDTEPADPRSPGAPNRAELACVHFHHVLARVLEADDEIVIAVPPTYDDRQLGILVGIARELDMNLVALVASPVALAPDDGAGGRRVVVDVGLHRSCVSFVDDGGLGVVRPCPDVGLVGLRRQWVKAIGAEFVRKTRFDPLHDAATEQKVHDAITGLLDAIAERGSEPLEIDAGGRGHRATVTGQALAHAGHGLLVELGRDVERVVGETAPDTVLLTAGAARVPGLADLLRRQASVPVDALAPGAAARGLARDWPERFDRSVTEGVTYHTHRFGADRAAGAPG